MARARTRIIVITVTAAAIWGILTALNAALPAEVAGTLMLCPANVAPRPYTLLTYALVHADALHLALNITVMALSAAILATKRLSRTIAPLTIVSTIVAAAVFCAFAYIAGNTTATLAGASAPAFALATCVCINGRHHLLTALITLLAVAGLFGANAGGAAAHCSGLLTGAAAAYISAISQRRADDRRKRQCRDLHDKIHTSGYASLSPSERKFLSTDSET